MIPLSARRKRGLGYWGPHWVETADHSVVSRTPRTGGWGWQGLPQGLMERVRSAFPPLSVMVGRPREDSLDLFRRLVP